MRVCAATKPTNRQNDKTENVKIGMHILPFVCKKRSFLTFKKKIFLLSAYCIQSL